MRFCEKSGRIFVKIVRYCMSARGVDSANFDLKTGIIFALDCIVFIAIACVFAMKTWSLPKVT